MKVDPSPILWKGPLNQRSFYTVDNSVGAASQGPLKLIGIECMVFVDGTLYRD